jgi:hypothetical protein
LYRKQGHGQHMKMLQEKGAWNDWVQPTLCPAGCNVAAYICGT